MDFSKEQRPKRYQGCAAQKNEKTVRRPRKTFGFRHQFGGRERPESPFDLVGIQNHVKLVNCRSAAESTSSRQPCEYSGCIWSPQESRDAPRRGRDMDESRSDELSDAGSMHLEMMTPVVGKQPGHHASPGRTGPPSANNCCESAASLSISRYTRNLSVVLRHADPGAGIVHSKDKNISRDELTEKIVPRTRDSLEGSTQKPSDLLRTKSSPDVDPPAL